MGSPDKLDLSKKSPFQWERQLKAAWEECRSKEQKLEARDLELRIQESRLAALKEDFQRRLLAFEVAQTQTAKTSAQREQEAATIEQKAEILEFQQQTANELLAAADGIPARLAAAGAAERRVRVATDALRTSRAAMASDRMGRMAAVRGAEKLSSMATRKAEEWLYDIVARESAVATRRETLRVAEQELRWKMSMENTLPAIPASRAATPSKPVSLPAKQQQQQPAASATALPAGAGASAVGPLSAEEEGCIERRIIEASEAEHALAVQRAALHAQAAKLARTSLGRGSAQAIAISAADLAARERAVLAQEVAIEEGINGLEARELQLRKDSETLAQRGRDVDATLARANETLARANSKFAALMGADARLAEIEHRAASVSQREIQLVAWLIEASRINPHEDRRFRGDTRPRKGTEAGRIFEAAMQALAADAAAAAATLTPLVTDSVVSGTIDQLRRSAALRPLSRLFQRSDSQTSATSLMAAPSPDDASSEMSAHRDDELVTLREAWLSGGPASQRASAVLLRRIQREDAIGGVGSTDVSVAGAVPSNPPSVEDGNLLVETAVALGGLRVAQLSDLIRAKANSIVQDLFEAGSVNISDALTRALAVEMGAAKDRATESPQEEKDTANSKGSEGAPASTAEALSSAAFLRATLQRDAEYSREIDVLREFSPCPLDRQQFYKSKIELLNELGRWWNHCKSVIHTRSAEIVEARLPLLELACTLGDIDTSRVPVLETSDLCSQLGLAKSHAPPTGGPFSHLLAGLSSIKEEPLKPHASRKSLRKIPSKGAPISPSRKKSFTAGRDKPSTPPSAAPAESSSPGAMMANTVDFDPLDYALQLGGSDGGSTSKPLVTAESAAADEEPAAEPAAAAEEPAAEPAAADEEPAAEPAAAAEEPAAEPAAADEEPAAEPAAADEEPAAEPAAAAEESYAVEAPSDPLVDSDSKRSRRSRKRDTEDSGSVAIEEDSEVPESPITPLFPISPPTVEDLAEVAPARPRRRRNADNDDV